jgi:hypothetical protein
MNLINLKHELEKKKTGMIWKIMGYKDNTDQMKDAEQKIITEQRDRYNSQQSIIDMTTSNDKISLNQVHFKLKQDLFKVKLIGREGEFFELRVSDWLLNVNYSQKQLNVHYQLFNLDLYKQTNTKINLDTENDD